ncbi:MAG: DNA replication and repair protein RecF [Chlorobiaceae bacterium]|nr:DNA replication and repair protein RecF [Chlorobiaceae bacterium]
MRLKSITYENFRNHRFLRFNPSSGINLLYGPNGSGKTSILEGIHFCALTKGFLGSPDNESLSFSKDYFLLNSIFCDGNNSDINVKIIYTKEKDKQVIVNSSEIKRFSQHLGRIPCITFSPQEIVIVHGAPAERRRFIDNTISQTDRRYLDDLLAYRRVLLQRNALLLHLYEIDERNSDMLTIMTEQLAKIAASLIYARIKFLSLFFYHFKALYSLLMINEDPAILYRCSAGKISEDPSLEELYSLISLKFKQIKKQEIARTQTLIGPHRDELVFLLNEKEIKKYASQGQMRTFLICLKLSQHRYLSEITGEEPLSLLDDVFSELDEKRTEDILGILETYGQTIITSASKKEHSNITALSIDSFEKNSS